MRQWAKAKIEKTEKPKSQKQTKTKFKNKGAHKIGATQTNQQRAIKAKWPSVATKSAAPHTGNNFMAKKTKRKKNNKILFSRLLTLTLTASKNYEAYSLSLPAKPRQKLSLTAWPHKMHSYTKFSYTDNNNNNDYNNNNNSNNKGNNWK